MQERYIPERELRFDALCDILVEALPRNARILDLATGLGSLAERISRRMPAARIVAVDHDPVLLRIARESLERRASRIRWVDLDLRSPTWTQSLPPGRFDAAVSTTALHWLRRPALHRLHRDLAQRIRRGGLFLNGDHIPYAPEASRIGAIVREIRHRYQRREHRRRPGATWNGWWATVARDPRLAEEMALRRRRYPREHHDIVNDHLPEWLRSLRSAGFREAEVAWQLWDDRIVMAVR
jgi:SAM-dependent methyltransferase